MINLHVVHLFHRLVCEAVLQQLDIKNLLTWQHGLSLVRNVVGGVDYKV